MNNGEIIVPHNKSCYKLYLEDPMTKYTSQTCCNVKALIISFRAFVD